MFINFSLSRKESTFRIYGFGIVSLFFLRSLLIRGPYRYESVLSLGGRKMFGSTFRFEFECFLTFLLLMIFLVFYDKNNQGSFD